MNAERLLALYEQVAEAPDAVPRLRRFVLDLAVRGKLLEQHPADEPAADTYSRTADERIKLKGRWSGRRDDPAVLETPPPWAPPRGWIWVKLGTTGRIFSGTSINAATRARLEKAREGRPFVATKDIGYGFDPITYANGLIVPAVDQGFKVARSRSVFICAEGGSAGRKIALSDREICFGNKLLANEVWDFVCPEYVRLTYMSDTFYSAFADKMTGVIGGISIASFVQLPFIVPPLAEQHRIVAKVDELMALLDRLKAARITREANRDRLTTASLARLTAPDSTAGDFSIHARFALATLSAFTSRPDQIKRIRQTILSLAVSGKLDTNSAVEEAVQLPPKGDRVRRSVPDSVAEPETVCDWSLPLNWRKASVASLLHRGVLVDLKDGNHGANHPKKSDYVDEGPSFIAAAHVRNHRIDYASAPKLSKAAMNKIKIGYALEGDVIFTHKASIGRVAIAERDCILTPQTTYYRANGRFLLNSYLMRALESEVIISQYADVVKQTTRDFLPILRQYNLFIPLPPLSEQHRIVAKVDALMALCDRLEAALSTTDATRARLLEALLHGALDARPLEQDA